ncbi:MAG: hypothetical protein HYX61_13745 [Gammaproteobacteria bacterium]|jgi:hypothetical protein|nr:hypothetical protein [Gammaproteobacteria bacterium]
MATHGPKKIDSDEHSGEDSRPRLSYADFAMVRDPSAFYVGSPEGVHDYRRHVNGDDALLMYSERKKKKASALVVDEKQVPTNPAGTTEVDKKTPNSSNKL